MSFLWCLLLPYALGLKSELENTNFRIKIEGGTLISVVQTSPSDQLNLASSSLHALGANAFQNITAKSLNLEGNELKVLPKKIFSSLTNLEYLSFGDNKINEMHTPFIGLKNLKTLNFSNNPMGNFLGTEFFGVPKGAEILTKGNEIWSISTRLFDEPMTSSTVKYDGSIKVTQTGKMIEGKVLNFDNTEENTLKMAEVFHLPKPVQLRDVQTILCMSSGIVSSIDVFREGDAVPEGCTRIIIEANQYYLNLTSLGIKSFQHNWYHLQDIPIYFMDLSKNEIAEVTPEILNNLPASITLVTLQSNQIKQIKTNLIENVNLKLLNLKDNLIEDIEENAFAKTNLWGLYLTGNKLADISFISSLPSSLVELSLGRNEILSIPDETFLKLSKLNLLNLDGNGIFGIQDDAFVGLTSLNFLILSNNAIAKIEENSLRDLKSLSMLYLNGNVITHWEKGAFSHATRLKQLNLANNKVRNITKESFPNEPLDLDILNLDNNEINVLEEESFINLPKRELRLNGNKISSISQNTFKITTLRDLSLRNNTLKEIKWESFNGLPALEYLWLSDNEISTIKEGPVKNLANLMILDISGNPINRLKSRSLAGLPKDKPSFVYVARNKLASIEGGLFDY